jgi:hypothetical protein
MRQLGADRGNAFRQRKLDQMLVHDIRSKQGLPFDGHNGLLKQLGSRCIAIAGVTPRIHPLKTADHA